MRARSILASRRALLGALLVAMACTEDHAIAPPAVAALVIFPDTATVTVGDSLVLQAVARDQNGHAFVGAPTAWTSRSPALATVSAMGLVKAVASGTDTITATAGGLTATARITVVALPSLAFTRDSVGFAATANGPNPGADSVTVVNPGGGALSGVALGTITYGPGASGWLGATLRGTATPDILVLSAQTGTLAIGSYTATVSVTAAAATNSPHNLKVSFVVGVGAAASMAANGGNAQSATVNTAVAVAPSVIVRDQFNNPVPGSTVSFAVRSGGGSVTGGSQQTNASGIATVGSWTLGTTAGPDTLTASSGGLSGSPVIFTATATAGPATKLVFTQQPASAQAGVPITPAVQVSAQDAYGNTATSYATAIAVAIGTNPPGTGVLSGTTSVGPSAGAAAFGNLSIDKTGTGYTLVASSGTLAGATSSGFTITRLLNRGELHVHSGERHHRWSRCVHGELLLHQGGGEDDQCGRERQRRHRPDGRGDGESGGDQRESILGRGDDECHHRLLNRLRGGIHGLDHHGHGAGPLQQSHQRRGGDVRRDRDRQHLGAHLWHEQRQRGVPDHR